ncbi:MAG: ABC-F family ATP-binding cassette domain-containing protein [Actinomycetota bacterium]|nr:ABC-F family ATP-binding cassette domain-containing protein [Actinomycetota bacterium]
MRLSSSSSTTATLVAQSVVKSRGAAVILAGVDLVVGPEHRIGVVGPNGVGKTTLLRVLAGLEAPDSGHVSPAPPTASIGYLAQEPEALPGETLRGFLGRKTAVDGAEARLAEAAAALASLPLRAGAEAGYSVALERYLALGGPDFESRIGTVLDDIGLHHRLLAVAMAGLSGGQLAKAALAVVLLSRFDVLLLDEPTNDLDFDGLDRLEHFLEDRGGGLVVVSHDRAFLERVVSSVLELDEAEHTATHYAGGWRAYLEARSTARRHAEEAYGNYVRERSRLQSREREQRQWSVQGVSKERKKSRDADKAQRDFRLNRTEKQASKVRITEKALERLEPVAKVHEPWRLNLRLEQTGRSGDLVAVLESAVVHRGEWTLGPVDVEVRFADRVVILGPNGSGKTTLIAALLGRVPLESGTQRLGPSVVVGELGQERRRFVEGDLGLLDMFVRASGMASGEARSLLAKFGLSAHHVLRRAASLSPGERTRAELALMMARGANCLVLDEPTNHLDLPAIEQLETAIDTWEGTLLLVTHDRRLLESVRATRGIELAHGGTELAQGRASTLLL